MVVYLFNSGLEYGVKIRGHFLNAEGAKVSQREQKKTKRKYKMNSKIKKKTVSNFLNFGIFLVFSFLRSLRNLRALRVQKFFGILYSAVYWNCDKKRTSFSKNNRKSFTP